MITSLYIRNYALIQEQHVDLKEGLTIITGETGAGKSILLGALGLIVGQRADTKVLRDPEGKCIVEGTFALDRYNLRSFFEKRDLDFDPMTTIRREITPYGKSRAFVNDTPVSLQVLKELGLRLIDIHSQHQTLTLNSSGYRFQVVDAYAGLLEKVRDYRKQYQTFKDLENKLEDLKEQERRANLDRDYYEYQWNELEEASLKAGELSELEQKVETFEHAIEIKNKLSGVIEGLSGSDENLLSGLLQIRQQVDEAGRYHPGLGELGERLKSTFIELEDISAELENAQEEISLDPEKAQEYTDRLDQINQLLQKHRVSSVEELITISGEIQDKLSKISSLAEEIGQLEAEISQQRNNLELLATKISGKRRKSAVLLEKEVREMLKSLAMPDARLNISFSATEELTPQGKDQLAFLFTANKGGQPQELSKVASGGELSRLMLTFKSILSRMTALPAIVFDEIDTGVSGDVADKMGNILKSMATEMQVISITHLPQIAGKGDHHFKVYKLIKKERTESLLQPLGPEDRLEEIAKMLSGKELTPAALENARELLGA